MKKVKKYLHSRKTVDKWISTVREEMENAEIWLDTPAFNIIGTKLQRWQSQLDSIAVAIHEEK